MEKIEWTQVWIFDQKAQKCRNKAFKWSKCIYWVFRYDGWYFRKADKISALSSNNLDKYEYLTGEDLGLKPSTVEPAKFECSPLGKVFNKGLKEEERKEVLLKILINIEDENEE